MDMGSASRIPQGLTLAVALLALLCLCSISSTATAECLASFREIKFADGSARVKNYVCRTEGAAKPEIRIEFDRLSEAAAGSLLQGTPYPDLERLFGNARVIQNAVAGETKKLFDEFGIKRVGADCTALLINAAAGGKEYRQGGGKWDEGPTDENSTCGDWTRWYLGPSWIEMPLPADVERYRKTDEWPGGYDFHYGSDDDCWKDSPIACTRIWRLARPADLANFVQNQIQAWIANDRDADSEIRTAQQLAQTIAADENDPDTPQYDRKRYFALIDYLTRGGWPNDFLIISGYIGRGDCEGCDLTLSLDVRELILDVAFVQNISDRPVSIDGLLGSEGGNTQLRPVTIGATSTEGERIAPAEGHIQLQPGETIAVPLAISFVMDESIKEAFGDQRKAEKIFKRIREAKPRHVFTMASCSIRKVRESFGAPKVLKPATYAFGPELRLGGLVMDGKSIVFDQASRNFMKLTMVPEFGSCPYLYAWDDGQNVWVRHGKVIHAANSKDKEGTDTIAFPGFRSKFRLAEEEPEVSYINQVKLEVELKDGTGMTLRPDFEAMSAQDQRYATIKAGDRIEFSFALPPTVSAADVKQSTLAVTGYYRRYSDLLMARQ